MNNPYAEHVKKIIALYEEQATAMLDAMEAYFQKTVSWTKPEGGMFIWVTLPEGLSALDVFQKAMEKKVAFVPGDPFCPYRHRRGVNTFRLNYLM